jgi:hypothetical protein
MRAVIQHQLTNLYSPLSSLNLTISGTQKLRKLLKKMMAPAIVAYYLLGKNVLQ